MPNSGVACQHGARHLRVGRRIAGQLQAVEHIFCGLREKYLTRRHFRAHQAAAPVGTQFQFVLGVPKLESPLVLGGRVTRVTDAALQTDKNPAGMLSGARVRKRRGTGGDPYHRRNPDDGRTRRDPHPRAPQRSVTSAPVTPVLGSSGSDPRPSAARGLRCRLLKHVPHRRGNRCTSKRPLQRKPTPSFW